LEHLYGVGGLVQEDRTLQAILLRHTAIDFGLAITQEQQLDVAPVQVAFKGRQVGCDEIAKAALRTPVNEKNPPSSKLL